MNLRLGRAEGAFRVLLARRARGAAAAGCGRACKFFRTVSTCLRLEPLFLQQWWA